MKIWFGPYLVRKCRENGYIQIRKIHEEGTPLLVNGYRPKLYKRPLLKENFISSISKELNVIGRPHSTKLLKRKIKEKNKEPR